MSVLAGDVRKRASARGGLPGLRQGQCHQSPQPRWLRYPGVSPGLSPPPNGMKVPTSLYSGSRWASERGRSCLRTVRVVARSDWAACNRDRGARHDPLTDPDLPAKLRSVGVQPGRERGHLDWFLAVYQGGERLSTRLGEGVAEALKSQEALTGGFLPVIASDPFVTSRALAGSLESAG